MVARRATREGHTDVADRKYPCIYMTDYWKLLNTFIYESHVGAKRGNDLQVHIFAIFSRYLKMVKNI